MATQSQTPSADNNHDHPNPLSEWLQPRYLPSMLIGVAVGQLIFGHTTSAFFLLGCAGVVAIMVACGRS